MITQTKATLLIVDDSVENLSALSKLLKPHYLVRAAPSGERGLQAAESLPKPDLILLDVMMPGMDGYEVLERLRRNPATADIPVIFLTALSEARDEEHGLELGAADYIAKPIKPAVVLARVRTQIEAKQARDWLNDQNAALKERLSSILDSVDAVIWSAQAEPFKLSYVNSSVVRLTGHTDQALLAEPSLWLEMVLPEDRERVAKAFDGIKETGWFDCDYRISKPDGCLRWISGQGKTVYDGEHRPLRIDGVATDITERRVNEIVSEAIGLISKDSLDRRATPDLLARIVGFISDRLRFPIATIGLRNPAEERIQCLGTPSGSPAEAPSGLADIAAAVSEGGEAWREPDIARSTDPRLADLGELGGQALLCLPLRVGETVVGALALADRSRRPDIDVLTEPLRLVANHLALELDRRRTAGILDHQARYLRTLIDSLRIFVGTTTPEGMVTDVNQTSLNAAGLTAGDVVGQPFEDTYWWSYSPEAQDRIRSALAEAAAGAEIRFADRVRVAEGRYIAANYVIAPVRGQDGRVTHLIHSGVDMTQSSEVEEALRRDLGRLELWLEACLDACADGLALLAWDSGRCLKANAALRRLLGYARDEPPGMTLAEIVRIESMEPEPPDWSRLLKGEIANTTLRLNGRRKDGSALALSVGIDRCLNEAGEVDALLASFRAEGGEALADREHPGAGWVP